MRVPSFVIYVYITRLRRYALSPSKKQKMSKPRRAAEQPLVSSKPSKSINLYTPRSSAMYSRSHEDNTSPQIALASDSFSSDGTPSCVTSSSWRCNQIDRLHADLPLKEKCRKEGRIKVSLVTLISVRLRRDQANVPLMTGESLTHGVQFMLELPLVCPCYFYTRFW